jgi:cardiolipin synthase
MLWWWFMALLHAAGLATAVRTLLETRTPQGTIAWVVLLVTFPYVALPACAARLLAPIQ